MTALITGAAVVGVCAVALKNADLSEAIFNPANFEKLENERTPDNYDYVAGDGEEMDLADENADSEKSRGSGDQQVLQTNDGLPNQEQGTSDSSGGNEIQQASGQGDNRGGYEFTNDGTTTGVTVSAGGSGGAGGSDGTAGSGGQTGENGQNDGTTPTPSPTPTPGTADRKPTAWEEAQLKPRDPSVTEYGTLQKLTARIDKEYYFQGDSFDPADAVVTGQFLEEDGDVVEQELEYGENGYQVSFSTSQAGSQTAVFLYSGMTARATYRVLNTTIEPKYEAVLDGDARVWTANFPALPFQNIEGGGRESYEKLLKMQTEIRAVSGGIFDMTEFHRAIIAHLGDEKLREAFEATEGGSYRNVVFLKEDDDGYLKNMLTGFSWVLSGALQEENTYLYYPAEDWGTAGRNVVDLVRTVPDGFKIRRVTEDDGDLTQYRGDQVLEQYTGSEETVEIPMGVTVVRLQMTEPNVRVKKLVIPQSVQSMDIESIRAAFPNLTAYEWADGEGTTIGNYSTKDGVLYCDGGRTLVSVPGAMTEIRVPAEVTKLSENCFVGLSGESRIEFLGEEAPKLDGSTGFTGTLVVPASEWDVVCKRYLLTFGMERYNWKNMETSDGKAVAYGYSADGPFVMEKMASGTLSGIPQDSRGKYTIDSEGVSSIGAGAFAGCDSLSEIEFGGAVRELQDNSLVLPDSVEAITLTKPGIRISGQAFGAELPNIVIYVPDADYSDYLESWSEVLDPVYGAGTAELLLVPVSGSFLYEDGVKYMKTEEEDGEESLRVVRVYEEGRTALSIKEGTTEIEPGAFQGCTDLEILVLPKSLTVLDKDALTDCGSLETILCENPDIMILNGKARSRAGAETAEIFKVGGIYADFLYEDGVVYGETDEGAYTLLNVRTDYAGELEVKGGTSILYQYAFRGCGALTKITIPDEAALVEIGDSCFAGLSVVDKAELSGCVNLKTIGENAFSQCVELSEVTLPSGLESLGDRAFYSCVRIKAITLPETLTYMGEGCFENCTALRNVTMNSQLDGISRYAFYGCKAMRELDFGAAQKEKLTVVGAEAFAYCTNLDQLDWQDVTALSWLGDGVFEGCDSLAIVKFPASLLKLSGDCFSGCEKLSIVQLNSRNVTTLGNAVFGDTLPGSLHFWVTEEVFAEAFKQYELLLDGTYGAGSCERILGVIDDKMEIVNGVIYELTEEGRILKEVGSGFSGQLAIPVDTIRIAAGAFEGNTGLTDLQITIGSTVSLGDRCFADCPNLKTVEIFGNVTEWGDETFMDCTGLQKVYIGYSGTGDAVIERVGTRAFKGCTGLAGEGAVELRAPVLALGKECFMDCTALASVSTSATCRNALVELEDSVFENCTKLRVFLVSSFKGLTKIGKYAFRNCDTLANPAVPAGVTSIGEGCFMDCDSLATVSIYGAVEEYPKECFKNCPKLNRTGGTAAAFAGLKRIGESAYEGCVSLSNEKWNFANYKNLEEIGNYAFRGCANLTKMPVPETVKLGEGVFDGCVLLETQTQKGEIMPEVNVTEPEAGQQTDPEKEAGAQTDGAPEKQEPTENSPDEKTDTEEESQNTGKTEEDGTASADGAEDKDTEKEEEPLR